MIFVASFDICTFMFFIGKIAFDALKSKGMGLTVTDDEVCLYFMFRYSVWVSIRNGQVFREVIGLLLTYKGFVMICIHL